jgi:hypothetical protein
MSNYKMSYQVSLNVPSQVAPVDRTEVPAAVIGADGVVASFSFADILRQGLQLANSFAAHTAH